MSANEFMIWLAYRKKYGPMNDVRKYDRPAALIGSILSHAHGGKSEMRDLMPFGKEQKEVTLEDLAGRFGGRVNIGKRG